MLATGIIVAEPGEHFSLAHLLPEDEGADILLTDGGSTNAPIAHLGRLQFRANAPGVRRITIQTHLGRCEFRVLVTFLADILRNAPVPVLVAPIDSLFANLDNPENWVALGDVIENNLEKPELAAMAYMEATSRGTNSARIFAKVAIFWYNEYTLYSGNGNEALARTSAEEAKKWLKRAIATDPNVAEPYYWLALVYRDERRSGEEIAGWQSYLKLGPSKEQRREAQQRLAVLLPGVPACRACGIRGVPVHRHASLCDVCSESLLKRLDTTSPRGADGRRAKAVVTTHANPCSVCESGKFHHSLELYDIVVCDLCIDALAPSTIPDEHAPWNIGDVIESLYEIKQVHSSGGMGWVYRAEHREWHVDLALKRIKRDVFQREADIANFENEAETWVSLGFHPNIVSCHYVRRIEGLPCIVSEYVEGGTLGDWIRDGRLYRQDTATPLARILDVAIQIAWGLHYAHEQGIVHQDIKPANILMTSTGSARVADFGLARAHAALQGSNAPATSNATNVAGARIRTRAYASPEQISKASKLTRKTDIWSWACTVIEMFARGCCWYWGPRVETTLNQLLETSDDPANPLPIPPGIVDLLRHCLRGDPARRPDNMQNVAARLTALHVELVGAPYVRKLPSEAQLRADGLNNRALSLLDLGNPSAAASAWDEALLADPRHAISTYNRGLQLWRSGKIRDDDLVRNLDELLHSASPLDGVDLLLARVHLERNDSNAALQILKSSEYTNRDEINRLSHAALLRLPQSSRRLRYTNFNHELTLTLSHDGMFAITYAEESGCPHKACLWDIATGECVREFVDNVTSHGSSWGIEGIGIDRAVRTIISCNSLGALMLWNVATGNCVRKFVIGGIKSAALSADGEMIACGFENSTVSTFSAKSGQVLRTFSEIIVGQESDYRPDVDSIHFTEDGSTLIAATVIGVVLLDAETGACKAVFSPESSVRCMSVNHNETHIAIGGESTITIWEIASGRCIQEVHVTGAPASVTHSLKSVSLSADGTRLLSVDDAHNTNTAVLRLWDTTTGRCIWSERSTSTTLPTSRCARIVPNGFYGAVLDLEGLAIWQLGPPKPTFCAPLMYSRPLASDQTTSYATLYETLLQKAREAHEVGDAAAVAKCIREARIVPGHERASNAFREWTTLYRYLPRGSFRGAWEVASLQRADFRGGLVIGPDSKHVIVAYSNHLAKFNVDTYELETFCSTDEDGIITGISVAAQAKTTRCILQPTEKETCNSRLIAADYDSEDFVELSQSDLGGRRFHVSSSGDGRFVVLGGAGDAVELRDASTGRYLHTLVDPSNAPRDEFDHATRRVESVWMSADGVWVFSGHGVAERRIRVWHVPSGRCVQYLGTATSSPAPTGRESHAMHIANMASPIVPALTGSFDATLAASGGYQDHLVKIWDARTGECRHVLSGHDGPITSVCFTSDAKFLVSGSADRTLKIWDVATGKCVQTLTGHQHEVAAVCLTPDARVMISVDQKSTIKFWALDWELMEREPADWDDGALPFLRAFLSLCTPYLAALSPRLKGGQLRHALTRGGFPRWTNADFDYLMETLACAGFGWLRREGVRAKLQELAQYPAATLEHTCEDAGKDELSTKGPSHAPKGMIEPAVDTRAKVAPLPESGSEKSGGAQTSRAVCSFCQRDGAHPLIGKPDRSAICYGCVRQSTRAIALKSESACSFCGGRGRPVVESKASAICDKCLNLFSEVIDDA